MHRGGKGYDSGKGGKAFERDRNRSNGWSGSYRRDYQPPAPDSWSSYDAPRDEKRASTEAQQQHRDIGAKGSAKGAAAEPPARSKSSDEEMEAMMSMVEKRIDAVQKEFKQALHQKSQKENDKFDIIFNILSELQARHAQLEESVSSLAAGCGQNQMMGIGMGMGHDQMVQQHQFGAANCMSQHYGQMPEMIGNISLQQQPMPMRPYGGEMMMQQVLVMPSANGGATMAPQIAMQSGVCQGGHEAQLQDAHPSNSESTPVLEGAVMLPEQQASPPSVPEPSTTPEPASAHLVEEESAAVVLPDGIDGG
jgi:hypothetical protein